MEGSARTSALVIVQRTVDAYTQFILAEIEHQLAIMSALGGPPLQPKTACVRFSTHFRISCTLPYQLLLTERISESHTIRAY